MIYWMCCRNIFRNYRSQKTLVKAVTIVICLNLFLCSFTACSSKQNEIPTSDGDEILLKDSKVVHAQVEEEDLDIIGEVQDNGDVIADINNLPKDIRNMVPLCEAVVLGLMDAGTNYSCNSPVLVWHCIHLAMVNSGWKSENIKMNGDRIIAKPDIVKEYMFGMFGELTEAPQIPADLSQPDDRNLIQITFNNDLDYSFKVTNMNAGYTEISKVVYHPDTTVDIDIFIRDYAGNEIAAFSFKLRSNTRDTSQASTFHYEIVGTKPLDDLTVSRMERVPFLVESVTKYGSNVKEKLSEELKLKDPNAKANNVEEVLLFSAYGELPSELTKINDRINKDVSQYWDDKSILWNEMRAYPSENDKYVQDLVTVYSYREDSISKKILTYNYDVKSKREITKSDACRLLDISEDTLMSRFNSTLQKENSGDTAIDTSYTGFIIYPDGTIEFYFTIVIENENEKQENVLAKFDAVNKKITLFEQESDIADSDYFNVDTVTLTHGR